MNAHVLRRIAHYYSSGSARDTDVMRVGPFAVVLHRFSDQWYLSYATPTQQVVRPSAAHIAQVLDVFNDHDRVAHFEWVDELAPGLGRALVAAGFPPAKSEPLLAVVTADAVTAPDVAGAQVRIVNADEDLAPILNVSHAAMPELGPVTPAELQRVADEIRAGRRIQVVAHCGGPPVSVGDASPAVGVAEIAGVGTLPEYRRRGLGGLVTATLAREVFGAGVDVVYLTAATLDAARVYERVGFRRIATGRSTHVVDGHNTR